MDEHLVCLWALLSLMCFSAVFLLYHLLITLTGLWPHCCAIAITILKIISLYFLHFSMLIFWQVDMSKLHWQPKQPLNSFDALVAACDEALPGPITIYWAQLCYAALPIKYQSQTFCQILIRFITNFALVQLFAVIVASKRFITVYLRFPVHTVSVVYYCLSKFLHTHSVSGCFDCFIVYRFWRKKRSLKFLLREVCLQHPVFRGTVRINMSFEALSHCFTECGLGILRTRTPVIS